MASKKKKNNGKEEGITTNSVNKKARGERNYISNAKIKPTKQLLGVLIRHPRALIHVIFEEKTNELKTKKGIAKGYNKKFTKGIVCIFNFGARFLKLCTTEQVRS